MHVRDHLQHIVDGAIDFALVDTAGDRAADRAGYEMRTALAEGRANDERRPPRKGGSQFWASGEMTSLRGADGTPEGYVELVRDRTRQHETGLRLRETQDRF